MFHQAPYIRALTGFQNVEVYWCVRELLPDKFRVRGYPVPTVDPVKVIVAPNADERRTLFSEGGFHVFFGLRGLELPARAFQESAGFNIRRIQMIENRRETGIKFPLRLLGYRLLSSRVKGMLDATFCVGYYGVKGGGRFFSGCRFDPVIPFAHVVEPVAGIAYVKSEVQELMFIGQLIRRKGLDVLLRALVSHSGLWRLTVVGDGVEERRLRELAINLGVNDKVVFLGGLENGHAMRRLANSHALILPSRFDGWGAVVNEALHRGVPVVCSDTCGASDLINDSNGYVFQNENIGDLRVGLTRVRQLTSHADRQKIAVNSASVSGPVVAQYLLRQLDGIGTGTFQAMPPWRR